MISKDLKYLTDEDLLNKYILVLHNDWVNELNGYIICILSKNKDNSVLVCNSFNFV